MELNPSLFSDLTDDELRLALIDLVAFNHYGVIPPDGILSAARDKYVKCGNILPLSVMEKDLLAECASRWMNLRFSQSIKDEDHNSNA